jgi:hypothetical protein
MLKRSKTFAAIVAASLSLGLTALAMPALDTVLTQGYDDDASALIVGAPDAESESLDTDCLFEGTITYETTSTTAAADTDSEEKEAAVTPVTVLSATAIPDGKTTEDFAGFGPEDPCGAYSVDVTGPNGQINHGTFQSAWVHALKALGLNGKGCLVSSFSKLGYGDAEKLTTAEAQEAAQALADATATTESASGDIQMSPLECDKGKDKAPGLSSSDGEKPAKGPAWKTDENVDRPGKGK